LRLVGAVEDAPCMVFASITNVYAKRATAVYNAPNRKAECLSGVVRISAVSAVNAYSANVSATRVIREPHVTRRSHNRVPVIAVSRAFVGLDSVSVIRALMAMTAAKLWIARRIVVYTACVRMDCAFVPTVLRVRNVISPSNAIPIDGHAAAAHSLTHTRKCMVQVH